LVTVLVAFGSKGTNTSYHKLIRQFEKLNDLLLKVTAPPKDPA
jgi:hypothetical protein